MKGSRQTPSWPRVSYEAYPWVFHGDISRRQRQRHRGTYDAAVVPKIAKARLALPAALLAECEDASAAMVRFDAEATAVLGSGELAPLPAVLLRTESAASSHIEHLTAGARQLALAELGAPSSRNAEAVSGNVAAMRAALDLADSIDMSTVLTMHRALMGADDPHSGRLREQQVWIGGAAAGPHGAMFVPPHHTRVPAAMKDLFAFVERTDIPVIAHAALAHAHFETIHPFTDGNGRTGRALIHAMSRHSGLTQRMTVPVSAGLLADVDSYFESLTQYRDGKSEAIVRRLIDAVFAALRNARALLLDLQSIRSTWTKAIRARSDSAVWRAIDVVLAQPVIDVAYLEASLGVSTTSAQSAIDLLVSARLLEPFDARRRRSRVWQADEVLRALDAFAARAGRRV
ncbi:MAG TPA: Fic family protein [Labilithrix sp.]|nr:Fic family protein [Labilithrix sp.]